MRKVLAVFLALLMLCAGASAESLPPKLLPESYFLADIQRNYPDWSVRVSTRYGSGRYEGEMAQYAEVSLYRITDEAIELLELTVLVNPIREGDDVPWSVHALIPVEIVSGAADDLCAMTAEEIFDYGVGAAFTDAARNLLVPSLRAADETVTQLMSCSRFLLLHHGKQRRAVDSAPCPMGRQRLHERHRHPAAAAVVLQHFALLQ